MTAAIPRARDFNGQKPLIRYVLRTRDDAGTVQFLCPRGLDDFGLHPNPNWSFLFAQVQQAQRRAAQFTSHMWEIVQFIWRGETTGHCEAQDLKTMPAWQPEPAPPTIPSEVEGAEVENEGDFLW